MIRESQIEDRTHLRDGSGWSANRSAKMSSKRSCRGLRRSVADQQRPFESYSRATYFSGWSLPLSFVSSLNARRAVKAVCAILRFRASTAAVRCVIDSFKDMIGGLTGLLCHKGWGWTGGRCTNLQDDLSSALFPFETLKWTLLVESYLRSTQSISSGLTTSKWEPFQLSSRYITVCHHMLSFVVLTRSWIHLSI